MSGRWSAVPWRPAVLGLAIGVLTLTLTLMVDYRNSERIPDFGNVQQWRLTSLNGSPAGLEVYRNKTLLINFWATWCGPCRQEMPDLQRLSEVLNSEKYAVIGITVDEDLNLAKEFLLKQRLTFPQFSDAGMEIASELLAIRAFPETLLVSPQGEVVRRIRGVQPWTDADFIQTLLEVEFDE